VGNTDKMGECYGFYTYAQQEGFPIPTTFFLYSRADAEYAAEKLTFPCILKPPLRPRAWTQHTKQKAFKASAPEEFIGFANRYADLSAANGQNILDAGGTGSDNSSVWLVGWGPRSVFGIFPKGSKAGLVHENLGKVTVETTAGVAGARMRAYQDHFVWKCGLALKDWRYAVRIANIDVSDLAGLSGTQETTDATFIVKMMSRAIDRLPNMAGIKPVFYANRTILSLLRVAALEKSVSAIAIREGLNQFGQTIYDTKFLGIPVRIVDALTEAEAQVT